MSRFAIAAIAAVILSGCALVPEGTDREQTKLNTEGAAFEKPFEQRALPEIPGDPTWRDVLHRAFMANGELEASYFEWKAAFQRIDVAAAWPNSNVMLGYSVALGPSGMKTFDRMTFSGGVDTMKNLSFPAKASQSGKVALDEARASGERFRAAKFDLQRRVLTAWAEYALLAERARVEGQRVTLTRAVFDAARSRVQAGGSQDDLLRAGVERQKADDALGAAEAELKASRASLNGFLARDPDAPLAAPGALPSPRTLPSDDAALIAVAVAQNPELEALAQSVKGRSDVLERARMEWIPDVNPFVSFTGGAAQVVGASVVLPTTIKQIQGGIREADAMLKASEAMLRQSRRDRIATFVATLVLLRDAERQAALFEHSIVPATERIATAVRQRYVAGTALYLDLIESQRALLDARLVIAEARTMREKRLAELEALIGADIETLKAASEVKEQPHDH